MKRVTIRNESAIEFFNLIEILSMTVLIVISFLTLSRENIWEIIGKIEFSHHIVQNTTENIVLVKPAMQKVAMASKNLLIPTFLIGVGLFVIMRYIVRYILD